MKKPITNNDIDYRENTLYLKLKSYSERGLPSNVDIEKISIGFVNVALTLTIDISLLEK